MLKTYLLAMVKILFAFLGAAASALLVGGFLYLVIDFFPVVPFVVGMSLLFWGLLIKVGFTASPFKAHFKTLCGVPLVLWFGVAIFAPGNRTVVDRPYVLQQKHNLRTVQQALQQLQPPYPANAQALEKHLSEPLRNTAPRMSGAVALGDYHRYEAVVGDPLAEALYRGAVLYQAKAEASAYQLYAVGLDRNVFTWPEGETR